MPASMFDKHLPAFSDHPRRPFRLGPCAMGPVGDGDTVTFMRVWLIQNQRGRTAAATGTSGEHVSDPHRQKPPYRERWMIQTELEPGSDDFREGKAHAVALAMAKGADGRARVDFWEQDVDIDLRPSSGGW